MDPPEADAQGKRFTPAPDRAHIYVTRTSIRGSLNAHRISLNGTAVGNIAWNTHLLLEVQPGTHEVSVITPEKVHAVTVTAGRGENVFLATVPRTGWAYARAELQALSESDGRRAVLDTRRAAIAPHGKIGAPAPAAGTYVNPAHRWGIAYPAGWRLDDYDRSFVKLRKGAAVVGIHTGGVPAGWSLEDYAREGLKAWQQNLGNVYEERSRRRLTLASGLPALEVVHHIGTRVVGKSRKIIIVNGDRAFWIDAEVYLQSWPAFESEFEQIIESFRAGG